LRSIATASPPANVMWPAVEQQAHLVADARHQRIDILGRLHVSAHVMVIGEAHAVRRAYGARTR
jgi:hypothetical protein